MEPNKTDASSKNRCTGQCCKAFSLPYSPEELKQQYEAWKLGSRATDGLRMRGVASSFDRHDSLSIITGGSDPEIYLIYPMLEYLGQMKENPLPLINPMPKNLSSDWPGMHMYSCKHFDDEEKVCTIYDNRPSMCRRYGTEKQPCEFKKCTWQGHQESKRVELSPAKSSKGVRAALLKDSKDTIRSASRRKSLPVIG
jgi:Fe-S-cluster containining protein